MAEPTGLAAVIEAQLADRGLVPEPTEQLDLLGLREVPADKRPRGRPRGAINRRTERVAEYLLSKYPDPLEGLIQMCSVGVQELAAALGCTQAEAFAEKRLCIAVALPFIHRRQPLAVDLTNTSVVHLSIHPGGAAPAASAGGMTVLGTVVDIEENQGVGEAPDATV